MNIKDLSISDLKSALDFTRSFIEEMKIKAKEEKIKIYEIGAYQETVQLEEKLYSELSKKVRFLK
jgi:hypothetical protein|nr:hypothetical protein [uncultured Flavobacterium sp.]